MSRGEYLNEEDWDALLDRTRPSDLKRDPQPRPTIQIVNGQLPRVLSEVDAALASGGDLYQRGGQIVRVARLGASVETDRRKRFAGSATILGVDADYMRIAMSRAATFEKYDGRMEDWKTVDPPIDLARALLSQAGEWSFDPLAGIIECPTLRPDGSLLQEPGYDARTALLFVPGGVVFPKIAERPTPREGFEAIDRVDDLLRDFPFESGAARSVALAALMTSVVRRSLPTAPMIIVEASKMGSGKTLVAEMAALIATGRRASMMSHTAVPEEERKRLLAALLEGDAVIIVDNIEASFGSDVMCAVLTAETFRDRVLGSTKNVSVPTSALFIGTGNNIVIKGDLTTRVLIARIVVEEERPEQREFTWSPLTYIPANRPGIVRDILTGFRAYLSAGSPDVGLKPFGRFEAWSDLVRATIVWSGRDDPCETRLQIERSDPVREALVELTSTWWGRFGSVPVTAPEIIAASDTYGGEALRAAIRSFIPRGDVTPKALSTKLGKFRDRIESGYRIVQLDDGGRHLTWRVDQL